MCFLSYRTQRPLVPDIADNHPAPPKEKKVEPVDDGAERAQAAGDSRPVTDKSGEGNSSLWL